jgi:hypothetical protein
MRNVGASELTDQCKQIKDRVLATGGPESMRTLIQRLTSREGSQCILSLSQLLPKLGTIVREPTGPVAEASSGKTSELRETGDKGDFDRPKLDRMCAKFVERLLIDAGCLEELSPPSTHPRDTQRDSFEQNSGKKILMLTKISSDVTYYKFRAFFEGLNVLPDLLDVRFCFYKGKYSLILHFLREKEAARFYSCCDRRLSNFTKTFGDKYEAFFVKKREAGHSDGAGPVTNVTQFIGRVFKRPQRLSDNFYGDDFVGVVVRHLHEQFDAKNVVEKLQKSKIDVRILEEATFRDLSFCLLRVDTIDDAENACQFLHRRVIFNNKLKCSIHPASNYSRRSPENENFKAFFRAQSLNAKRVKEFLCDFEGDKKRSRMSGSDSDEPRRKDSWPRNGGDKGERKEHRRNKKARLSDSESSSDSDSSSQNSKDRKGSRYRKDKDSYDQKRPHHDYKKDRYSADGSARHHRQRDDSNWRGNNWRGNQRNDNSDRNEFHKPFNRNRPDSYDPRKRYHPQEHRR